MSFFTDVRERFFTFESFKGLLFAAAGVFLLLHQEYILTVFAVYLVIEGLRKITVNRVAQLSMRHEMVRRRLERARGEAPGGHQMSEEARD